MNQATLGELEDFLNRTKAKLPKTYRNIPIYLGDDDELNGIHCGWYIQIGSTESKSEDTQYLTSLINERSGNIEPKGFYIVIS